MCPQNQGRTKNGLLNKKKILGAIRELRQKNPQIRTPLEADNPSDNPWLRPKQIDPNAKVERVLELIREAGLSSRQAREVLDQAKDAIDLGEKEVNEMLNH